MKLSDSDIARARDNIAATIGSFIEVKRVGSNYKACCPFHDERTPSFTINPVDGYYHCFGCGVSGDAIGFVMEYTGSDFRAAVEKINGQLPTDSATNHAAKPKPPSWTPIIPAPLPSPAQFSHYRLGIPSATWHYRNIDGDTIGFACRFDHADGGKDVLPICVAAQPDGEPKWRWLGFSKPRPLYGLHKLPAGRKIMLVEGEKTADAAQAIFGSLSAMSWLGGVDAVDSTDWAPLYGKPVTMWPDNDEPGLRAMRRIYEILKPHGGEIRIIPPSPDTPKGWDLADVPPDGFSPKQYAKESVTTAEAFFMAMLEPTHDMQPGPPSDATPEQTAVSPAAVPATVATLPPTPAIPPRPRDSFRMLGYSGDNLYFYQYEKKQVIEVSISSLSTNALLGIADEAFWDMCFPGKSGFNKTTAANWVIRESYRAGVYDPTRTRGRGAWMDDGRAVYHFGSHLWVDGQTMEVNQIRSKYVYQLDRSISCLSASAMTDAEGQRLLDIARMFRWNKPASAALLLGWVTLAPFSGAIKWRPHIWLTGGAGCGKSTILNDYVHLLMAGTDIFAQGNSTEAGLRQTLKTDAIPVLFDESEQNNDREESRVQNVISLIRQASTESGAVTYKGTSGGASMQFMVRSMFCLSSIGVGIKHQADFERLTILSLRPKREDDNASDSWDRLKAALAHLRTDDTLPARMFFRTLSMLPAVTANVKVFVEAASRKFNSVREGDQYGTLLAGCWCALNQTVATPEQAIATIESFDWEEYRENIETEESSKALLSLMEAKIRVTGGDVSVFEVITAARTGKAPDGGFKLDRIDAEAVLSRHGMKISADDLLLSNNSKSLSDLFRNTQYHADWRNQILRVTGAKRHPKAERINGVSTKCVALPLHVLGVDTDSIPF